MRHVPYALGEQVKVVSKQLEPDTIPELVLSRLNFVIDVSEFLSRKTKLTTDKERKEGKPPWARSRAGPDIRRAINPYQRTVGIYHNE
jgi:hypothetical protein